MELYVGQRGKNGAPKRVLLDFDATDDPTHGEQEGSYYHGYYRQHMYHPLVVFDGETGHLLTAVLRAGNTHASRGAVAVLRRIVGRLRRAWGEGLEIEIHADAGFAVPALYEYCEREGVDYAIGLITDPRLVALAEPLLEQAQQHYEAEGLKARLLTEGSYRAEGWERKRRVVYKAEAMAEGTNTRFVVTNKTEKPEELYGWVREARRNREPRKGPQAGAQGRPVELLSVPGQPVSAHLARGGLLVVRRAQGEVGGGRHEADAVGHFATSADQDRRPGAPVSYQDTSTSGVRAPRSTPVAGTRRRADSALMNNPG